MQTDKLKCFVISPIGEENSTVRNHADAVFECIIQPAVTEAGYHPVRGDHMNAAGKITEQMIQRLLRDDLIIAVLTFANPNVYYELAIAQSAGKNVILLAEKGTVLPFDVKDMRVLEYDLDARAIFSRRYITLLLDAIRHQFADGERRTTPFGDQSITPLGSGQANLRVIERFSDVSRDEEWGIVSQAQALLYLSGISLLGWHKRNGYLDRLKIKAQSGCEIRILLMHEKNPALQSMLNDRSPREYENTINEIQTSFTAWEDLCRDHPAIKVRKVARGILYNAALVSEADALISPYWYTVISPEDYPVLWAKPGTVLHRCVERELAFLWELNAPMQS